MSLHHDSRPLPLGELFDLCDPLPWQAQCAAARDWLVAGWVRGAGEGTGNADLLAELHSRTDPAPSFNFYHVLALELLTVLREEKTAEALAALGASDLAEHLLAAPGIPPEVAAHYAEHLL